MKARAISVGKASVIELNRVVEVVKDDKDGGFWTENLYNPEPGLKSYCLEKRCAHLDGGTWKVYEPKEV